MSYLAQGSSLVAEWPGTYDPQYNQKGPDCDSRFLPKLLSLSISFKPHDLIRAQECLRQRVQVQPHQLGKWASPFEPSFFISSFANRFATEELPCAALLIAGEVVS